MLQAQQIVALACQIAKAPGFTAQAGQFLNLVLESLAIEQNLDAIRRTTTISVSAGVPTYNLPAAFLRAREVFYQINGEVFNPTEIDLDQYDMLFKGTGVSDYPYNFAVDMAQTPPTISLYPQPVVPIQLTVRYQDSSVTIPTPEISAVVPWFIDHSYLVHAVAERLMLLTDDDRIAGMKSANDDTLRQYLRMNNGNTLKTVALDPRVFRTSRNLPPTKLLP